jgi:hypothetical protein
MSVADLSSEFEARQRKRTCIQFFMAEAVARRAGVNPVQGFEQRQPRSLHLDAVRRAYDMHTRGAVPAGSSDTWMQPFASVSVFLDALASAVRRKQVLGQLGAIQVPPNVRAPFATGQATASWIARGASIPVSKGAFADITLIPLLLAGIVASTNEVLKATGPQAEAVFEALLTNAAVTTADTALLDPAQAGVPELSPPSLTHGAFTTPSTGSTVAALNADLGVIATHMQDAGIALTLPVVIMSPASALRLGGLVAPGGQSLAAPVVQSPAAKDQVVLLDASYFVYTDGGLDVSASAQTSLEMSDAPTGDVDDPAPSTAPVVSLWQTNATAFRLSQWLNWALADPAAVGVVTAFGAPTP